MDVSILYFIFYIYQFLFHFQSFSTAIKVSAKVPGSIYTDLINNKVIGNPYYRFNDLLYRWVANDNWTYVKTFSGLKINQIN